MPSSRRMKVTGLVALLTVCVIFYVTNGASSTHNSAFYTRTVAAINDRQAAKAREDVIAEERQRLERVEKVQKEHEAAMSAVHAEPSRSAKPTDVSANKQGPANQNPMVQKPSASSKANDAITGGKSVAGRKYMKDGKVVTYKSSGETGNDGVAKVGNVGPQSSHAAVGEQLEKEDQEIQAALNEILKKGPIIIFSKTYCPFSKKAKHILLDLYSITPPPYVVELDEHKLGEGLQKALEHTTGRRTVPNVLINGRSIGGGDDIQELHEDDKLISTISSMGGKRIVKLQKNPEETKKSEMKFKA